MISEEESDDARSVNQPTTTSKIERMVSESHTNSKGTCLNSVALFGQLVLANSAPMDVKARDPTNIRVQRRTILARQKEKMKKTKAQVRAISNPFNRDLLEKEVKSLNNKWKELYLAIQTRERKSAQCGEGLSVGIIRANLRALIDFQVEEEHPSSTMVLDNKEVTLERPKGRRSARSVSSEPKQSCSSDQKESQNIHPSPVIHNFFQPTSSRFMSDRSNLRDFSGTPDPVIHYSNNNTMNDIVFERESRRTSLLHPVDNSTIGYPNDYLETQKYLTKQYLSTTKPIRQVFPHRQKFRQSLEGLTPPAAPSVANDLLVSQYRTTTSPKNTKKGGYKNLQPKKHLCDPSLTKEQRRLHILDCLYQDRTKQIEQLN